MNHHSPPPVPPVKPTGRKLARMLGFGRNAEEQRFPSSGSGALAGPSEISGVLKDEEKKNALPHYMPFFHRVRANLPPWSRNSMSDQLVTANLPVNHMYLSPEREFSLSCFSSHKEGSSSLKCKKLKDLESTVNINTLTNLISCCLSKFILQKYAVLLFGGSWLLQGTVRIYCSDQLFGGWWSQLLGSSLQ